MLYLQLNSVLCTFYSAIGIWKYPSQKSNLEKYFAPYSLLRNSSMHGKGYKSIVVFFI